MMSTFKGEYDGGGEDADCNSCDEKEIGETDKDEHEQSENCSDKSSFLARLGVMFGDGGDSIERGDGSPKINLADGILGGWILGLKFSK